MEKSKKHMTAVNGNIGIRRRGWGRRAPFLASMVLPLTKQALMKCLLQALLASPFYRG
ncbi:hypothetical protein AMTR_s04850p00006760, partial [Amborella trichopoda]